MAEIAVASAIAVLKKTIVIVGDLVIKEASRFSQLQKEISWVEREVRRMQSYLKDAEHRQGDSAESIRDLAFDVEEVMEKYFPVLKSNKSKSFNNFLNCIPRVGSDCHYVHNFVTEIEDIKARVEDINRARLTYGIVESSDQAGAVETNRWDERVSFPHVHELNIVGFDDHTEKLVAQVHEKDLGLRVISIIGMPGLGKTTLAKKVYNSVRHSFDVTAWVCVSQKPNVKNILREIAKQVGLAEEKWEDVTALFDHLTQRRYVLVFDDLWRTNAWDALKIAIPMGSGNGSRIVLTSRNWDVGVYIGGRNSIYQLQPLDDKCSEQVFNSVIGPRETTNESNQLEEIRKKILRRCGGVPLAIEVAAGLLKPIEPSASAWAGVLDQMGHGQDRCSEIFSLSYRDLPIYIKPCFLYFGMFPEDHEIDTVNLIKLWAAEGFINGNEARDMEDVGYDYLNHLIARNLVHVVNVAPNGKVRRCRIHDVLHDLCIRVAEEINFFNSYPNDNLRVRRITANLSGLRDLISSNYQNSKLRSLLVIDDDDDDDESKDIGAQKLDWDFLNGSNLLSVLHLEHSFGGTICLNKVCGLRNLTYLSINGGIGKTLIIPNAIINLERLESLEITGSVEALHFPMVVWNMKRLRHLLLPRFWFSHKRIRCSFRRFHPKAISFHNFRTLNLYPIVFKDNWFNQLSNLRTLSVEEANEEIAELLLNSTLVLDKLENLTVDAREGGVSIRRLNLSRYDNLSYLSLTKIGINRGPVPDELPPNLTEIHLWGTQWKVDPLEILQKLPKLRSLTLGTGSFSGGRKMVCTGQPGNFPQLSEAGFQLLANTELTIEEGGMPNLRNFRAFILGNDVTLTIREGGMPNLKDFRVNICGRADDVKLNVPSRIHEIKSVHRKKRSPTRE